MPDIPLLAQATNSFPSEENPAFVAVPVQVLESLLKEVQGLRAEVANLQAKTAALETQQANQTENSLIQLRLIKDLREAAQKQPTPAQKDRAEALKRIIIGNGGKILAKDARRMLRIPKPRMTELIKAMGDEITVKPYHLNRNWKVLVLR